ncbi:PilZ domain-containing protein [Pediococcus acidilactici]
MVIEDVMDELDKCLIRNRLTRTQFANALHVSKQAVSNWFSSDNHVIPLDKLISIADLLKDERFKFVVADYVLDMRLLVKNEYASDPLSQFMRVNKEEEERRLLNEQVQVILAKPVTYWNDEERSFLIKFRKEFSEERQAEIFTENFAELQEDPDHTVPLGFVQTPQSFYNADIFQFNLFLQDAVVNEQDFFSRDVNVLNGANGHALFTGSNAVFLREAVDKVGGFPTDTITEDFELGTKINSEGYKSLATVEPVSSGITPVDMKSVIKQRTGWARGVIQSCRNLHIFLNPKINLINRIILINTWLYWWSFLRRLIYIAAPILYALFKVQVVNANFWVLMIVWAPGYFLLHFVLGDASSNIRNERWGEIQETFFAPYLFLPVLLESIGIHAKKFKVTDKKVQFSWRDKLYIIPYLILWSLTLIAIIKFNWGKWGSEIIVGSVITFWLVMHFINLSFCLFISMKRDIHRRSERFIRHAKGRMQLANGKWADFKTRDVSDGGFSFELDDDQNQLEMGTETTGIIYYKNYPIHFKSKVVRVVDTEPKWYGVTVNIEDRKDQDYYLELTYDGENKFLSKEQDNWLTPFDQLHLNVILRLKELERSATRFMRRS